MFAALALAACTPAAAPPTPAATPSASASSLRQAHDPGHVTGTITGPCQTRDGGELPDSSCTPGAYDPAVTAAVLCAPGYSTSSYRPPSSETTRFKYQVAYPAYGLADIPGNTSELDHDIPLELAGSNDSSNLWPEVGSIPNAKDRVESALHQWVCAASGTEAETRLGEAQRAIATNWITAEHVVGLK